MDSVSLPIVDRMDIGLYLDAKAGSMRVVGGVERKSDYTGMNSYVTAEIVASTPLVPASEATPPTHQTTLTSPLNLSAR
ncbi:hypothetical protein TNCV_493671 [Trichonephila clavipes]|nr:hypothetical protein TNCV_493671 [Trichonephila clavipes]